MLDIRPALYVLSSAVLLIVLLALRTIQTLLCTHSRRNWPAPRDSRKKTQNETATIALFLGSGASIYYAQRTAAESDQKSLAGGHTAEMLRIISAVGWKRYTKRIYIIAQGDTISVAKAIAHEKEIGEGAVRSHSRAFPARNADRVSDSLRSSTSRERVTSTNRISLHHSRLFNRS